jgi:hypothetical protein
MVEHRSSITRYEGSCAFEKTTIPDSDQLSDISSQEEIPAGLKCPDIPLIVSTKNVGDYGIVAVHLTTTIDVL